VRVHLCATPAGTRGLGLDSLIRGTGTHSQSGIWTCNVRTIISLRRRSYRCATWATNSTVGMKYTGCIMIADFAIKIVETCATFLTYQQPTSARIIANMQRVNRRETKHRMQELLKYCYGVFFSPACNFRNASSPTTCKKSTRMVFCVHHALIYWTEKKTPILTLTSGISTLINKINIV
jgi:hypothetical protein